MYTNPLIRNSYNAHFGAARLLNQSDEYRKRFYGLITRSVPSLFINLSVLSPPSASTWI